MTSKIENYIRSGHPGIAIASHEEARVWEYGLWECVSVGATLIVRPNL